MKSHIWKMAAGCLVVTAAIMGFILNAQSQKDYLTPSLRQEVEQLKKDIATTPTTFATMAKRGDILWRWSNAYSFTGFGTDPYLPVLAALAAGYSGNAEPAMNGYPVPVYLDHAVRELSLRDKNPDPFGTVSIDKRGPFPALSYQTVTLTYKVGPLGIKEGGAIILGRHMMSDGYAVQGDKPAEDNYVSVTASNPALSFKTERVIMSGFMGRSGNTPNPLSFRVQGGALKQGDTVTLVYGDTSKGSKGLAMQSYSNDRIPLPIFVDINGTNEIFYVGFPNLEVTGLAVEGVRGFAPSVLKPGEKFELAVRSQDRFFNRATGDIPAYELKLNGTPFLSIPAGKDAITVIKDLSFDTPGIYRLTIASLDGAIRGVVNPVLVEANPKTRIFWGETHAHSGMAEGMGSSEGFWTFGRDDARLDFLAHTDHDSMMDDQEWERVRQNAIDYYEPGKFIPYLGYEYSINLPRGGHHNVLFRTPQGRDRVPVQTAPALSLLYTGLLKANKAEDAVVIPHAHQPGDWRVSNPQVETLTEIMSGHGTFEWFSRMYLDRGHQVGFVGGSDDHLNHPGYSAPWHIDIGMMQQGGLAGVMAPEKSRDAIFDSLKARRNYATSGDRIIMEANINGTPMGERAPFSPTRHIEGRVIGTAPIDSIDIIRNGEEIHTFDYSTEMAVKLPAQTLRVQVGWRSDSNPPNYEREFPRETRKWSGFVEVIGAELVNATSPDFDNVHLQGIRREGNKIIYKTATRGFMKSVILELKNATAGTKVRIHLDGGKSSKSKGVSDLNPVETEYPAEDFILDLAKFKGGKQRYKVKTPQGYQDFIVTRALKNTDVLETRFAYDDKDSFTAGDYYYVRVHQQNGELAWSNPIWVGGYTPY